VTNGYFWDPATSQYFMPRGMAYQTWNTPVGAAAITAETEATLASQTLPLGAQTLWVRARDDAGRWGAATALPVLVNADERTDAGDMPVTNFVAAASPNPFRGTTSLAFGLAQAGEAAKVVDGGQLVPFIVLSGLLFAACLAGELLERLFQRIRQLLARDRIPDARCLVGTRGDDTTAIGAEACMDHWSAMNQRRTDRLTGLRVPYARLTTESAKGCLFATGVSDAMTVVADPFSTGSDQATAVGTE
jgi:hypothetical protein